MADVFADTCDLDAFRKKSVVLNNLTKYIDNEELTVFLLIYEWEQFSKATLKKISGEQITALLIDVTGCHQISHHIRDLITKLKKVGLLAKNTTSTIHDLDKISSVQLHKRPLFKGNKIITNAKVTIDIKATLDELNHEIKNNKTWIIGKDTALPATSNRDALLLFFVRNSIVLEQAEEKYQKDRLLFYILLKAEFQILFMEQLGSYYKALSYNEIVNFILHVIPLADDTKKINISTIKNSTKFLSNYFNQSKEILNMDAIENAKAVKWKKLPLVQAKGPRKHKSKYDLATKMDELKGQVNAKWQTLNTTDTRVSKPEEKQEIEDLPRDVVISNKTVELSQPVDQTFPPENLVISETMRDPSVTEPAPEEYFDSDASTDEDVAPKPDDKEIETNKKRKQPHWQQLFPNKAKRQDEDTCNNTSQPQLKS